ncbi:hypothetical protein CHCC20333_0581 [Bacillus paralicheniformis]|nr:hypothetical protein CHCC20333_0581 [Bacillus paralicheniformis]
MYFNGSSLPFRVPLYILLIFRFERKPGKSRLHRSVKGGHFQKMF